MLQVARLAPTLLGESRDLVESFFRSRANADGGFQNRTGESDLYYTVFGLEGLAALSQPPPAATRGFLEGYGDGRHLDLVHLSCLARAWATVDPAGPPPEIAAAIAAGLESFRSAEGGYGVARQQHRGSVYACFLVLGAFEDLRMELPDADGVLACLDGLRAGDGGYANHADAAEGSTPATSAAVLLLRHLDRTPGPGLSEWLLARCHPNGGFFAAPGAPLPDLLSTATALHALAALHAPIESIKEPCLDFVDTLWSNAGAFCGSWADDALDCEYSYYGLLALGHLSL
jgi:prenyltransferase beta subunit